MSQSLPQEIKAAGQGFAGGVNLRDAVNQIPPNQARKMENGVLDERGGWSKRLGSLSLGTFGASGDRIISAYVFFRVDLNPHVMIHTNAGKVYYSPDATANPMVWTQIATGLSTTKQMSWETFNGKCYFTNATDGYQSWDGTTYATYPSAPKAAYLRLWKDTMWATGVDAVPDRAYSSAAADAETWPVSNWVDISKGDGDRITAFGTDGTYLIVFKRRRTMSIYDPSTFANRVVDPEKGCESHFSVISFEGIVYFVSRRGICKYYGDSPSEIISGALDPFFDPRVINFAALNTIWAYTVGNRVGWCFPEFGQALPSVQVEYYPRLGVLSSYGIRAIGPFSFQRLPSSTIIRWRWQQQELTLGGSSNSNKFYQLYAPVGTDDGVSYTSLLETAGFDLGAATNTKYLRRAYLVGRGAFTMQTKLDFGSAIDKTFPVDMSSGVDVWSTGHNWGVGTWGPDSLYKSRQVDIDSYAQFFSFIFRDDGKTITGNKAIEVGSKEFTVPEGEWAIYGLYLECAMLGRRF